MEKPHFLENYKVHEKPEAARAAKRKEQRSGEKGVAFDKTKRIEAYVERLEHVFLHPDSETRERNISLLKPTLYKNILIKPENFPESFFEYQKKQIFERTGERVNFTEEQKEQEMANAIERQRISLDAWIDYLTSDDCRYPADIKLFAMQGILKLGSFDTEKYSFAKREKATANPFPEIDRESLSIVLGALYAKHHQKDTSSYSPKLLELMDSRAGFGDMYALVMKEIDQVSDKESLLPITEGEWRVFKKSSDPRILSESLAGKRSNLCIADPGAATSYLSQGDIEVFFSYNHAKQPVVPRIAIAVDQERGVYEVRGTYNKSEDIDPFIEQTAILQERMKDLPNGEKYLTVDKQTKKLATIWNKCFKEDRKTKEKIYLNPTLTKEELIFLYETNQPIEGFGYQRDPRIEEIRSQRDPNQDAPIVFECEPSQIAHKPEEITEDTKAYIGPWNMEIFQKVRNYPNIQNLFESFPDKKIFRQTLGTDPEVNSPALAEEAIKRKNIYLSDWGGDILHKTEFSQEAQTYELVRFSVKQLGLKDGATTQEIYDKAEELGLELCPAEVGPHLRLQYPGKELMFIAMKSITDRFGYPVVFYLSTDGGQLGLSGDDASPDSRWDDSHKFVFLFRK